MSPPWKSINIFLKKIKYIKNMSGFKVTESIPTDPMKFEIITATDYSKITDDDKKILMKRAKKLAKDCCGKDIDYYEWIIKKFGTFKKRTEKIIFVYDKSKKVESKFKKNYALGIRVKTEKKFNLTGEAKLLAPKMCEQSHDLIPVAWSSGTEILKIDIIDKGKGMYDQLKNQDFTKTNVCQSNAQLAKIFFIMYMSSQYSGKTFVINAYQNKNNYNFLTRLGCLELHISMISTEKILFGINGITIEIPVDCDYINLGKNFLENTKNLVMHQAIEQFYIENENLVNEHIKLILKNLNCIFSKAIRCTGFNYTVSAPYLQSQLVNFKGGSSFSADSFSKIVNDTTATESIASLVNKAYLSNDIVIDTQPAIIINEPGLANVPGIAAEIPADKKSSYETIRSKISSAFGLVFNSIWSYLGTKPKTPEELKAEFINDTYNPQLLLITNGIDNAKKADCTENSLYFKKKLWDLSTAETKLKQVDTCLKNLTETETLANDLQKACTEFANNNKPIVLTNEINNITTNLTGVTDVKTRLTNNKTEIEKILNKLQTKENERLAKEQKDKAINEATAIVTVEINNFTSNTTCIETNLKNILNNITTKVDADVQLAAIDACIELAKGYLIKTTEALDSIKTNGGNLGQTQKATNFINEINIYITVIEGIKKEIETKKTKLEEDQAAAAVAAAAAEQKRLDETAAAAAAEQKRLDETAAAAAAAAAVSAASAVSLTASVASTQPPPPPGSQTSAPAAAAPTESVVPSASAGLLSINEPASVSVALTRTVINEDLLKKTFNMLLANQDNDCNKTNGDCISNGPYNFKGNIKNYKYKHNNVHCKFKKIETPGAGNCFFESIIQTINQLTNRPMTATNLRIFCAESFNDTTYDYNSLVGIYIDIFNLQDKENLPNDMDEKEIKQKIFEKMRINGIWVGEYAILLVCQVLKKDYNNINGIVVFETDSNNCYKYTYNDRIDSLYQNYIVIQRENKNHYQSVVYEYDGKYYPAIDLRYILKNGARHFPLFKEESISNEFLNEVNKFNYPLIANTPCNFEKLKLKPESEQNFCVEDNGWLPTINPSSLDFFLIALYANSNFKPILKEIAQNNSLSEYLNMYWISHKNNYYNKEYMNCKAQLQNLIINEIIIDVNTNHTQNADFFNNYIITNISNGEIKEIDLNFYLEYIKLKNTAINVTKNNLGKSSENSELITNNLTKNNSIICVKSTDIKKDYYTMTKTKCEDLKEKFLFFKNITNNVNQQDEAGNNIKNTNGTNKKIDFQKPLIKLSNTISSNNKTVGIYDEYYLIELKP